LFIKLTKENNKLRQKLKELSSELDAALEKATKGLLAKKNPGQLPPNLE
jgi:hypothetical protein